MRTRNWTAVAVSVALSLAIAGCGDDDDEEGGSTDDPAGIVTTEGGGDSGSSGGEGAVSIRDFAFDPDELTVAPQARLVITNDDSTTHTFTVDDAGLDLTLEAGDTVEQQAPSDPGTYDFRCDIHPNMTGTLTVE
jgi:plastocyanin